MKRFELLLIIAALMFLTSCTVNKFYVGVKQEANGGANSQPGGTNTISFYWSGSPVAVDKDFKSTNEMPNANLDLSKVLTTLKEAVGGVTGIVPSVGSGTGDAGSGTSGTITGSTDDNTGTVAVDNNTYDIYALGYVNLTNGGYPTYRTSSGRFVLGDEFVLHYADQTVKGTIIDRGEKGLGYVRASDMLIVKNAEDASRFIAVLLPLKYASNPPTSDVWIAVKKTGE